MSRRAQHRQLAYISHIIGYQAKEHMHIDAKPGQGDVHGQNTI